MENKNAKLVMGLGITCILLSIVASGISIGRGRGFNIIYALPALAGAIAILLSTQLGSSNKQK